jgi:hypothetical protein
MAHGERDPLSNVPFPAIGGPERHRRRLVEQEPRRQRPLGHVDADLHLVGAGRGVPVDPADVVARLPPPDLGQLSAEADRGRPVLSGQETVHPPSDLEIERAEERLGKRTGPRPFGRSLAQRESDAHATSSTTSISGTGTASSTESMIEPAPISAASAS